MWVFKECQMGRPKKPAPIKKSGRRNRGKPPAISATPNDPHGYPPIDFDAIRQWESIAGDDRLETVPDFGVWQPPISKVAELLAKDQWFRGALVNIAVPDACKDEYDPRLAVALAPVIAEWKQKLLVAIDRDELKSSKKRRNIKDDRLDPEKTRVGYRDLKGWLEERGHATGEVVSTWAETEMEIAEVMADEAASLRALSETGGKDVIRLVAGPQRGISEEEVDEADAPALRTMLRAVLTENHRLKAQLAELSKSGSSGEPAKVDRSLHTKEEITRLTVIAALLGALEIDYRKQDAVRRIVTATENIDARISANTIRKLLSEMETAVFRRRLR
jgi:hypothetical protein